MALQLSELSWPRIEAELADGNTTVVVMAGSIEQHGPALPLSVDAIRADEIGERIADELGCFVAPTIRPAISAHHMAFPGTISLSRETFCAVVEDYCRSLAAHGFEHIALVTTHGGNRAALGELAATLDEDVDPHVFVPGDDESYAAARRAAADDAGFSEAVAGLHAGAAETSFVMETHPHLVARDRLAEGYVGDPDVEELLESGLDAVTDNGVLGDQRAAYRAAGRIFLDATVAYYVEEIDAVVDGDDA